MNEKVLSLYRSLLKQSGLLIKNKIETINQIKNEFKKNKTASSGDIDGLIKKGEDTLKFLRVTTPKITLNSNSKKFTIRNGEVLEIESDQRISKSISNWREGNIDPDMMKKHNNLLRRQHFLNRK